MTALVTVVLLLLIFTLIYFQVPTLLWTIIMAAALVAVTLFTKMSVIALIIFWILFLSVAVFSLIQTLRIRFISGSLIKKLQTRMPAISDTEREAIEAGNVWWEKDLFCGRPDWRAFLKFPKPELSAEEKAFLDNEVEVLCTMLDDWKIVNDERDLPKEVWDFLKQKGFFGLVIPKEFGGKGFSALAHSTVVTKIATRSISAAVNTMVPNSLGPAELVFHYGTDEQKKHYLPRLAHGEEVPCFALTGPEAGSDAGSITDTGVVCYGEYNGKKTLGIRLNWDKRYITLAPIATVLGLAIRLYDPEHLLGNKENLGITLCLIPTDLPGVEIGNRHLPLHLAFMNGPTRGKNVFIPIDWIIGSVKRAGQGWKMLMECLSIGRSISLPALSTACGKLAYRMTGAYAQIRKQFNTSIANFEGIEEALGEIAGMVYTLEACRQLTCSALDNNIRPSIVSAIAKYQMTEMARKILERAMDVHAGHMIQVGPRNFLAHGHIGIPICITVEGANILTRNLIIFGQGAIRCHPYILREVELFSAGESQQNTKLLDKLIFSHVGFALSNLVRSFFMGLTGAHLVLAPKRDKTAKYFRQLTRMSSALALLSDMCMLILGGNLKRKERISARLGDILSELYLSSAILKYYEDQGRPDADWDYVQWSVEYSLSRIQIACDQLLDNFPIKWVGKVLRFVIFPFGRSYKKPSDSLCHKVVKTMLVPSEFRDRLTQYCFIGPDENFATFRLEDALGKIIEVDPLLKKFQKITRGDKVRGELNFQEKIDAALKSQQLTAEEALKLREYFTLYHQVIAVDEFSFDLKEVIT